MNSKCDTCKQKCKPIGTSSFSIFCFEHDFCSYDRDENKPLYSVEVAKQLIFNCAAELYHNVSGFTNNQIADDLMGVLKEMDKM